MWFRKFGSVVVAAVVLAMVFGCTSTITGHPQPPAASGASEFNLVAAKRGTLPEAGPPVDDVGLPDGELIYLWDDEETPRAWGTTKLPAEVDVFELWNNLATMFPETGLWPLIVESFGDDIGELQDYLSLWDDPDGPVDGEQALLEFGSSEWALDEEWEFDELAAATSGSADIPQSIEPFVIEAAGIILVPATRPSDALRYMGFAAVNYDLYGETLAAIAQTWEDRFGAYPVSVGSQLLGVYVSNPPEGDNARAVAREHGAFCPDSASLSADLDELTDVVDGAPFWGFWWD